MLTDCFHEKMKSENKQTKKQRAIAMAHRRNKLRRNMESLTGQENVKIDSSMTTLSM